MKKIVENFEIINQRANEYAREAVIINGIEGFWVYAEEGLQKHHGPGFDHFDFYLKKKEFHWNC